MKCLTLRPWERRAQIELEALEQRQLLSVALAKAKPLTITAQTDQQSAVVEWQYTLPSGAFVQLDVFLSQQTVKQTGTKPTTGGSVFVLLEEVGDTDLVEAQGRTDQFMETDRDGFKTIHLQALVPMQNQIDGSLLSLALDLTWKAMDHWDEQNTHTHDDGTDENTQTKTATAVATGTVIASAGDDAVIPAGTNFAIGASASGNIFQSKDEIKTKTPSGSGAIASVDDATVT